MNGKNFAFSESLLLRPDFRGTGYVFYGAYGKRGVMEIPAYYMGLPVTAVGNRDQGFNYIPLYGCAEAEAAVFPETLKYIYGFAFRRCGALKEIVIPDGVESVGNYAFEGCRSLCTITVGSGVKALGRNAFGGCGQLSEINYSAIDCKTAGSLTYPVFAGCCALNRVNFNGGVIALPDYLFYGCNNLKDVILPEGLEKIGEYCFDGCLNIKEIFLPSSLKSVGWNAFKNCVQLSAITYGGTKEEWVNVNKNGWEYPAVKCKNGVINGSD